MLHQNVPRRRFLACAGMLSLGGVLHRSAGHRLMAATTADEPPIRIIVDADTANEIDDLFAIARAVMEPRFKMEGVTSAQWHTQEAAPNDTVGPSQRLNEELLRLMRRPDIPCAEGANQPLVNVKRPQPSDAARLIIEKAKETPEGEKLIVAILGPCTNLASAVLMDPSIVSRVSCHFIGTRYNPAERLWSKDEFNTNNDPNALDVLLDTPGLEFHLMTATTSRALVFEKSEVDRQLRGRGGAADFLVDYWDGYERPWQMRSSPKKETWIMWDIALIEAIARPALATAVTAEAPPENRKRSIRIWTDIDAAAMQADYWAAFDAFLKR